MRRRALSLSLGLLLLSTAARAQELSPANPLVHWGKWGAAGLSLTLHLLAVSANNKANSAYSELQSSCAEDPHLCDLSSDGSYADPGSEALYQESLHQDRRARTFLISGEVALLGTVALFVIDLTRHKGPPPNKPWSPEITTGPHGTTHLGFRVEF
jgi:hypothetical protein